MLNRIALQLCVVSLCLLSACTTVTTTERARVSAASTWALLPINNLSTTPRAGDKTNALLETQLRARGVKSIETYLAPEGLSLVSMLDTEREVRNAEQWAKSKGIRYGLTGTVHEWHYKSGPDKEPAVGLSLKLIDLTQNEVVWQGTTSKTGWGYSNISGVANTAVEKLLKQIEISRNF